MAYFSNGCEGDSFRAANCDRCVHDETCAVWLVHLLHNYDQFPEHAKTPEAKGAAEQTRNILGTLIPDGEDCTMFHELTDDEAEASRRKFQATPTTGGCDKPAPWIEEWLSKKQGRNFDQQKKGTT